VADYYADKPDLKTKSGVSYLIAADDTKILMDVGFNAPKEHLLPDPHHGKIGRLTRGSGY
jgi:hypothetical protein